MKLLKIASLVLICALSTTFTSSLDLDNLINAVNTAEPVSAEEAEVWSSICEKACETSSTKIIKAHKDLYTKLMNAIKKGDSKTAKTLIAAGTDVNYIPEVLIEAAQYGRTEIVNALIAAKADVNAQDEIYHNRPLATAVKHGRTETVKALIAAKADLNAQDGFSLTPLMLATMDGHTEIVKALIAAGANVNVKDNDGSTALIQTVRLGRTEIAKVLIAANADLNDAGLHQAMKYCCIFSSFGHYQTRQVIQEAIKAKKAQ